MNQERPGYAWKVTAVADLACCFDRVFSHITEICWNKFFRWGLFWKKTISPGIVFHF